MCDSCLLVAQLSVQKGGVGVFIFLCELYFVGVQCCSFVSLYGKNAWLFVHVRVGRVCPLFFWWRLIFFQVLGDKFF